MLIISLHTVKLSHSISVEFKSSKDMLSYSEHWRWSFTIYWSQRINNGVLLFSYCFHTNNTQTTQSPYIVTCYTISLAMNGRRQGGSMLASSAAVEYSPNTARYTDPPVALHHGTSYPLYWQESGPDSNRGFVALALVLPYAAVPPLTHRGVSGSVSD